MSLSPHEKSNLDSLLRLEPANLEKLIALSKKCEDIEKLTEYADLIHSEMKYLAASKLVWRERVLASTAHTKAGAEMTVVNRTTGGSNLVVRDGDNGDADIVTLADNEWATCVWDGSAWVLMQAGSVA